MIENHDRGFAVVGMVQPKYESNLGSALRACGCFGAAAMVIERRRCSLKCPTDVRCVARRMPVTDVDDLLAAVPDGMSVVVVERSAGAKPLHSYSHPARAFYVFGPEDGDVPNRIRQAARDVVYVPTFGALNLARCVDVVLYDRAVKRGAFPSGRL